MLAETEALYSAFSAPKPRRIDACPCCVDAKNICVLLDKPLRALTPDDLGSYASSVFLTAGSEDDFRYFLPRIFEISADVAAWYPMPEIVIGRLKHVRWAEWSKAEREAVEAFVLAWFDAAFAQRPDGFDADGVLCGAGRAGLDLQPLFDHLMARPAMLKALFEQNSYRLYTSNSLANAFWQDAPEAAAIVAAFLLSPEVELKIAGIE